MPIVGASGVVAGVTELLALEAVLVPITLVAVTVNVYAAPLLSPVMVTGEPVVYDVNPPTFEDTV